MTRFARLCTLLALLLAPLAAPAQDGPSEPPIDHQPVDIDGPVFVPFGIGGAIASGEPRRGAPVALPGGVASVAAADAGARALRALQDATAFCATIAAAYRVDCLAERIGQVAQAMPADGPYAGSRAALAQAAGQLRALARANADPAAPAQSFAAPSMARPQATTRPLTPVRPAALPAVNAAATAILEEAETVLLRSSATAASEAPQIQRIAAAVASNKVLLRSS